MPLSGLLWSVCEGVSSMLYDKQLVMSASHPVCFEQASTSVVTGLNRWVWKSAMSSPFWRTVSFRLPFNYTEEHLQWVSSAYCALSARSLEPITQCLLSALCITHTGTTTWCWCFFAIRARAHVCIWIVFWSQASDDRMLVFVDHYGINLPSPLCAAPQPPYDAKWPSSHKYSNTSKNPSAITVSGGAKVLVWLNTEDLESATLIWKIALDWLLAGSRYNLNV